MKTCIVFIYLHKCLCVFGAAMLEICAWGGTHALTPVVSEEFCALSIRHWRLQTVRLRHRDSRCSAPVSVCFSTLLLSIMPLTFWHHGTEMPPTKVTWQSYWDTDFLLLWFPLLTCASFPLWPYTCFQLMAQLSWCHWCHCSLNSVHCTRKYSFLNLYDCCISVGSQKRAFVFYF